MTKLTNSQLSVLQELAKAEGRTSFSPRYKPIQILHDLAFVDRKDGKFGSSSFAITEAGRTFLSERARRAIVRGLPESELNLLQHLHAEISGAEGPLDAGARSLAILSLWDEEGRSLERSGLLYIHEDRVDLSHEATEMLTAMAAK